MTTGQRVIVAGVSTRAAAESAALAGFTVTAIDAFGDLDQHPSVHSVSLGPGFSARAAARTAGTMTCDAVVYLANFENHPKAIETLASSATLWGNPAEIVRRVRDPVRLAHGLRERAIQVPEVRMRSEARGDSGQIDAARRWLVKPRASGGGRRIRLWDPPRAMAPSSYLQEYVDGTPASVLFVSAGGRTTPLGISRQLIGDPAFGATGFEYCGNILAPADDHTAFDRDARVADEACRLAETIADEFGLVGVNGVDFVTREGVPYVVEVNPRWCASMELVERAYGVSMFGSHAAACARGVLPAFDLQKARREIGATGKAIVYAVRDSTIGDTRAWLDDPDIRDVPHQGDTIPAGTPVCTVFAIARDTAACHRALIERANRVYVRLDEWARHAQRIG